MKQGGFIMTCQRLMSSSSDPRADVENPNPEKVPLNHDKSANDNKAPVNIYSYPTHLFNIY